MLSGHLDACLVIPELHWQERRHSLLSPVKHVYSIFLLFRPALSRWRFHPHLANCEPSLPISGLVLSFSYALRDHDILTTATTMALVAAPFPDFQEIQYAQPDHVNVFFRFVDGQVSAFDDQSELLFLFSIIYSHSRLMLLFFVDTLSLVGSGYGHCVH